MGLLSALTGNARIVANPQQVQEELRPILLDGAIVRHAFAFVRDQVVFTDCRLLLINKDGLTAKKVQWTTTPCEKFTCFSPETRLWVESSPEPVEIQFSRGVPRSSLYRALSERVLKC